MEIEDEVNSIEECSYNELSTSYDEMFEDFEKSALNHSILNKKNYLLKNKTKKILENQKENVNYDLLIKENLP